MTKPSSDTIDRLIGLEAGSALHAVRHVREKVVAATQGSENSLFDRDLSGLSVQERLFVALLACRLTPNSLLQTEYHTRLVEEGASPVEIEQVLNQNFEQLDDSRLTAILSFTRILIEDPVRADQAALIKLKTAGLSTPEIVTLAQLIAFVSYQVRLASGLKAMANISEHAGS